MKKLLLSCVGCVVFIVNLLAQVTQINANKSLNGIAVLNSTNAILVSVIDSTLWVSDGTLAGTFQLSDTIRYNYGGALLSSKYVFAGISPNCGAEIFITDGSKAGTKIIKDIISGVPGSEPDVTMATLNGFVYFTDSTAGEGRELWRTDGTSANTALVKDIVPGTGNSNIQNNYELFSTGTFLLLDVETATTGNELWRSDGTSANTVQLKDINAGSLSSNPSKFYLFNNHILFAATDASHGEEIWETDGTSGGTILLKDIFPGPDSSTYIPIDMGGFTLNIPVFSSFHLFNNHLFFMANDGVNGSAVWVTDGSTANTNLLKVIGADTTFGAFLILDAINLPGKFIFPFSNLKDRFELWQSDGTPAGTVLFKSFPVNSNSNVPLIYVNFDFNTTTQTLTYPLFNGNFFFSANGSEGNELWMSDGTPTGTRIVKDINPGPGDAIVRGSYMYTSTGLYFAATDGINGNELWKTDGTVSGTAMVKDINPGAGNADPQLAFINNNHLFFTATDNVDTNHTDLFVVDGIFNVLPVQLLNFTVAPSGNNALLQWSTSQELNSKDFTIQSSDDAHDWKDLGTVKAAGNSSVKNNYSFTDFGIMKSGKSIVYYRLVTTDIDGKKANSIILYLKMENNNQWDVRLLSNPVKGSVNVLLKGTTGTVQLSIFNLSGKIFFCKQIENQNGQFSIPVNLQRGVYSLVVTMNKERKVIAFIKD